MKIVIEITENDYTRLKDGRLAVGTMRKMLLDGTVLSEPHDRLISANKLFQEVGDIKPKNQRQHDDIGIFMNMITNAPTILKQEPTDKYEYHTDHTDCIWYGNDSGCPVTCSQYRDGWNDAMDYIFKNGNGYQPYRHDD